jgi:hypothetical protein
MCHFLYFASPLTLSEVRSMLPKGLAADFLPPAEARRILALMPEGQTAARLLIGACSCDLYLQRDPEHRREESILRQRYRSLGLDRTTVIEALDRHRRGTHPRRDVRTWQAALADFVAEHARNAGDTGFYREFSAGPLEGHGLNNAPAKVAVRAVTQAPATWLDEDRPALVVRI